MPQTAYATDSQLDAWLPDGVTAPTDTDRQLVRASELIDSTVRQPFTLDDDGLPTDPDIASVLADAVCAQVEQWIEVGVDNDIDGLAGQQVSVAGFSGKRAPELCPRAYRILKVAGLLAVSA